MGEGVQSVDVDSAGASNATLEWLAALTPISSLLVGGFALWGVLRSNRKTIEHSHTQFQRQLTFQSNEERKKALRASVESIAESFQESHNVFLRLSINYRFYLDDAVSQFHYNVAMKIVGNEVQQALLNLHGLHGRVSVLGILDASNIFSEYTQHATDMQSSIGLVESDDARQRQVNLNERWHNMINFRTALFDALRVAHN